MRKQLIELLRKDLDNSAFDQTKPVAAPEEVRDPLLSYLDMRDRIAAAIDQVPEIAEIASFRQLSLMSGKGIQLDQGIVAFALLRRTRALGDPEAAIEEMLELFKGNEGYARVVMILAGVQTARPSEIAADIRLVPLDKLQTGPARVGQRDSCRQDLVSRECRRAGRAFCGFGHASSVLAALHDEAGV